MFQLSRKNMAEFLFSLKGVENQTPLACLQKAWARSHSKELRDGKSLSAFIETKMPPIFEKLIKGKSHTIGLSINEIVSLGNQIEFANLSSSAVQNWVKRDVKELIGSPRLGKKYTVEQAATLFIVEDLKASLDFDSIRKVLALIFNNPDDHSDDVIDPLDFYLAYATIFEKIHHENNLKKQEVGDCPFHLQMEKYINNEACFLLQVFKHLNEKQKEIVMNVLVMASLTVLSAYYQTLTRNYMNATLFLQGL
ncbi:DUF1836 domain-containing protein [Bacillus sp. CGMCC 1.16607]|uniref:DUF1836 domain-containing protein n=1 Tax=Bacillus sp. CGMCC 1.16607 TaxID=3351842 RepID=UPI003642B4D0